MRGDALAVQQPRLCKQERAGADGTDTPRAWRELRDRIDERAICDRRRHIECARYDERIDNLSVEMRDRLGDDGETVSRFDVTPIDGGHTSFIHRPASLAHEPGSRPEHRERTGEIQ